ncbi:uncharacterized protein DUF4179 [Melghiribacillus thermohalophilus]|uniref:Uncharacterized protein DUF4179 n=1 Tax=Melghiribacillus thermohalophilus TaxID=1324956 RepID=A0A4V2V0Q6_9BACI|nr:DUF4179 domain-containing protein [Melghiribacillus thermohalophilus]TCT17507.1 uncharacterized protein DUF4179 [Melghiribacillus thermohalophilus]
MSNPIKQEVDKIEIPDELHDRVKLGVEKAKVERKKTKNKWLFPVTAAAVIILSFSLSIHNGAIASIPFVGEVIEKYIHSTEKLDYSSYKTAIGETAENELGKLTLNEVMMDAQQLFLSATFEPADDVEFDYQTYIFPTVKINGKDLTSTTGVQSVELNDSMFTIYNDLELNEPIDTENVQLEVSYDTWNFETPIEQPWTFDVEVSQKTLLAEKNVLEMNKAIPLTDGGTVTIEKVVATPISTIVYYDLSKNASEDIRFKLKSEDGRVKTFSSAYSSNDEGDQSFVRFNGINVEEEQYDLMVYDGEDKPLCEISFNTNK